MKYVVTVAFTIEDGASRQYAEVAVRQFMQRALAALLGNLLSLLPGGFTRASVNAMTAIPQEPIPQADGASHGNT